MSHGKFGASVVPYDHQDHTAELSPDLETVLHKQ